MRKASLLFLLVLPLLLGVPALAQDEAGSLDPAAVERLAAKRLSGYEGTPPLVVEKMLELAQVRPREWVYDLGSGDGRIVIMAAQKFGAHGVGIELDPRWVRLSVHRIQEAGLFDQAQIIEGDMLEQDLSAADVVTIYTTPYGTLKLRPHLEKSLKDGARVVTSAYHIPEWKPARIVIAQGDGPKTYELKLYVMSRRNGGVSFSKFGRQR
jgi:precorrin-6B methylase 2